MGLSDASVPCVLSVARLSIAPVKSLALAHPAEIVLEPWGVPENRAFYLVDEDGRLFDGSRFGPLVRISAGYELASERLTLGLPGGEVVTGAVTVEGEVVATTFWGRDVKGREVAGPWSEAISRFIGRPLRLMRPERPGDANDSFAVSIVSSASVEELGRRAGTDGPPDIRRFRMLVEVAGCRPHEEDEWIGSSVRIGDATVRVAQQDARCVVTTQDPDTGEKDLDTLGVIAAYRGKREGNNIDFGVYADVEQPGRIRVDDAVEPLA